MPEAIAFAFVAGVTPYVGLTAAWIVGLVTSIAGGRPGMISGATGALAVVMPGLVAKHGPGGLFYAIMLAGIVQLCLGAVRVNKLVRLISHPVMIGFCPSRFCRITLFQIERTALHTATARSLIPAELLCNFMAGWGWPETSRSPCRRCCRRSAAAGPR